MLPHSCRRVLKGSELAIARVRLIQPHCGINLAAVHASQQWPPDTMLRSVEHDPGSSRSRPPRPPSSQNNNDDDCVSDREWELRTGRAMDILQDNLPRFFTTGLAGTDYHLPLHLHGLLLGGGGNGNGKGKGHAEEGVSDTIDGHPLDTGIYARHIRLEYTPPVALPAPFPRKLHVEGLPLYVASSVFVRHTLNALYTDLTVAIHKVHVRNGGDIHSTPSASAPIETPRSSRRERAITIGILVSGLSRLGLSAERAEWDVTATYSFSPHTGLIDLHTVNSIDPAPSETVYTALQKALAAFGGGLATPGNGQKAAVNVARATEDRKSTYSGTCR